MAWIESHQALERHPKTLSLAAAMGWNTYETIGRLQSFWWWCVDYAEDGDLRKHNDSILGAAVGLNGDNSTRFVKAMKTARWLDSDPYFRVHDWWFYIGRFLQVKYKQHPDRWQAVKTAYVGNTGPPEDDNVSNNGCNNGSKTRNLTNQPNQPPRVRGGRGFSGGPRGNRGELERMLAAQSDGKEPIQ